MNKKGNLTKLGKHYYGFSFYKEGYGYTTYSPSFRFFIDFPFIFGVTYDIGKSDPVTNINSWWIYIELFFWVGHVSFNLSATPGNNKR